MKHPLIIVEGPDAVGKTTLAKFLARRFSAVYWHATGLSPLHPCMDAYHTNILNNADYNIFQQKKIVVLDRAWPSEFVYGGLFRPQLQAFYDYDRMRRACDRMNALYVFCSDKSVESAVIRHKENLDPTHPYDEDKYRKIYCEYLKFYESQQLELPNVMYQIEEFGHRLESFVNLIKAL